MRGLEPRGKNHSTDSSSVGGRPMKAELNGEHLQGADGDGCLGTVKDRPAKFKWRERDDIVAMLKAMWHEGVAASDIAAALTAAAGHPISFNAVIGKADRLGLPVHKNAPGHQKPNRKRKPYIRVKD